MRASSQAYGEAMYVPSHFVVDDPALQLDLLRSSGFGRLVTAVGRIEATPVPFVVDDGLTGMRCHLARANGQWRDIDGAEGLLLVSVADTYVSPRWYPTKAVAGEVVPTWNYVEIHLRGTVRVHHDRAWLRGLVSELTDVFEAGVAGGETWQMSDAPAAYLDKMLAGIVGVELEIAAVDAKAKLSQNRPAPDRDAVQAALVDGAEPRDRAVGLLMDRLTRPEGSTPA